MRKRTGKLTMLYALFIPGECSEKNLFKGHCDCGGNPNTFVYHMECMPLPLLNEASHPVFHCFLAEGKYRSSACTHWWVGVSGPSSEIMSVREQ